MPMNSPSARKAPLRRRRFEFSLSSLFLLTTAVAVLMSWVAVKRRKRRAKGSLRRNCNASGTSPYTGTDL